eukprot:3084006-Amphidinium_carterae.1
MQCRVANKVVGTGGMTSFIRPVHWHAAKARAATRSMGGDSPAKGATMSTTTIPALLLLDSGEECNYDKRSTSPTEVMTL